jgi:hypothetical protein
MDSQFMGSSVSIGSSRPTGVGRRLAGVATEGGHAGRAFEGASGAMGSSAEIPVLTVSTDDGRAFLGAG